MGTGLLGIVLPEELLPVGLERGRYGWELICDEKGGVVRRDPELGLEVQGRACNLAGEREVDRLWLEN